MENKPVLQNLYEAVNKSTNHPWLWPNRLITLLGYAQNVLGNPNSPDQKIINLIEAIYDEVPAETDDKDWWSDELARAMKEAEKVIE